MLTEKFVDAHLLWVEFLHQRVRIFGETSCEDNELVMFVHSLEELGDEGSHEDVDHTDLAVDLDRQGDVGVLHGLERGVHQSFI